MSADSAAAARLVAFAATPRAQPVRDAAYRELVERYLAEGSFADLADQIAAGLGLQLTVDPLAGVLATSNSDGPFRRRLTDIVKSQPGRSMSESRVLFGLTLLGIARTAFPQGAHLLDSSRVAQVRPDAVIAYLDRLAQELGGDAGDAEADLVEAEEGWRAWSHLREVRSGMARYSVQDKVGLVRRVCSFLEEEGHLTRLGGGRDEAWWRTTPRFRLAIHGLVSDSTTVGALRTLLSAGAGADLLPAGDVDPETLER